MIEDTQNFTRHNLLAPGLSHLLHQIWAYKAELGFAALAASAAGLFVSAHWTIAAVVGVAVLALSFSESEAFLLLAIFLLPLEWTLSGSVPVRDMPVVFRSLVIVGFILGRVVRGQLRMGRLLRPGLTQASLLFLCAVTVPVLFGVGGLTRESVRALWTVFTCIGFYFVILSWADSPERAQRVLRVLLFATIVTAAFAVFQEIIGDYTPLWLFLNPPPEWVGSMEGRVPSFFANPNFLAGYLNLILPFSLACWVLGEGRWKRLGAWTTGLGVLALLCTQSLGGVVAFGGVVALAILCFVGSWKRKLALLAAVCVIAIGFYFAKGILNPSHEGEAFAYDQSIRVVLWGIAWNFFTSSPLFGVGWGNFSTLYGSSVAGISWIPAGQFEVHNIYLQLLSETGLVGFGAFFLLLYRASRQALLQLRWSVQRLDKALAFGVLGAILTVLLHGFVDFFFQVSPQFGTLFWVLLALLLVRGRTACEAAAGRQEPNL
jgi:O-antigen ligase